MSLQFQVSDTISVIADQDVSYITREWLQATSIVCYMKSLSALWRLKHGFDDRLKNLWRRNIQNNKSNTSKPVPKYYNVGSLKKKKSSIKTSKLISALSKIRTSPLITIDWTSLSLHGSFIIIFESLRTGFSSCCQYINVVICYFVFLLFLVLLNHFRYLNFIILNLSDLYLANQTVQYISILGIKPERKRR